MDIVLHVVHVLAALGLIGLILIQHGKGADAGASFGGGASGTVFGSAGAANFLTRATAMLAVVFMVTSLGLAWMARQQATSISPVQQVLETIEAAELDAAPVLDDEVPALDAGDDMAVPPLVEEAVPAEESGK